MNEKIDTMILMRAMLIAHRTGNLMHAAERASDCGGMMFGDAAARLPYLLGELSNEVDDAIRVNATIDAYIRDPRAGRADLLEFIAAHARSATLPGESWVDVEATATAMLVADGEAAA